MPKKKVCDNIAHLESEAAGSESNSDSDSDSSYYRGSLAKLCSTMFNILLQKFCVPQYFTGLYNFRASMDSKFVILLTFSTTKLFILQKFV